MANELISALMDGECSAVELQAILNEAGESTELMRQWSRMNRVRDAMAGKPLQHADAAASDAFCAAVMSQLGEMAPAGKVRTPAAATVVPIRSNVVQLPQRAHVNEPSRASRSRPIMGWAAAASVTLIALAGGQAWLGRGAQTAVVPVASLAPADSSGDLRPVNDSINNRAGLVPVSSRSYTASSEEPVELRWTQLDPEAARELNGYMVEHNRAEQVMGGALGDARLAARNVDYRSAAGLH